MSTKYKFRDQSKLYFITFAVVGWVDVFTRDVYREALLDSWRFCQKNKDLEIYAWVIMTNHLHMIIGTKGRPMEKIVGEMKSFTSKTIRDLIEGNQRESRKSWMLPIFYEEGEQRSNARDWQFWKQDNHPIELFNQAIFYQKMEYIHNNPVKAGFVRKAEDYPYSSAGDFYDMKGPIELSYVV